MLWLEGRGKRKRGHSCVICNRYLIPKAQLSPCLGNTGISSVINQTLRPSWKVQCSYLEQVRPGQLTPLLEDMSIATRSLMLLGAHRTSLCVQALYESPGQPPRWGAWRVDHGEEMPSQPLSTAGKELPGGQERVEG